MSECSKALEHKYFSSPSGIGDHVKGEVAFAGRLKKEIGFCRVDKLIAFQSEKVMCKIVRTYGMSLL